jgi:hypothetical protein
MKKKLLWVLVLLTVLLGAVSTCSAKGRIKKLDTWPKRFYSIFCEYAGSCFRDMRTYPNEVYLYAKYCFEFKTLNGWTITLKGSGEYDQMVSAHLKVPVDITTEELRTALIAFFRASADYILYPKFVYSDLESVVDEYLSKALYYRIKDKCTVYKHTCISCTKTKDERFYLFTAH